MPKSTSFHSAGETIGRRSREAVRRLSGLLSRNGSVIALLAAILAVAAALRFWGLSWGLPLKRAHIDEAVVIHYTMRFFTGDLNPHVFFDYPTLFLYVLWTSLASFYLIAHAAGVFASLDQFVGIFLNGDSSSIYVIARALSAATGVGSAYLTYRIARENFSSPLLAALIVAVAPLGVLHSHYATVDVFAVFLTLLSLLFCGRYFRGEKFFDLAAGSLILGLATAAKYYPGIFALPLLIFLAVRYRKRSLPLLACAGALVILGFIIGCPYSVLDFPAFSSRFTDRFHLIVWSGRAAAAVRPFNPFAPVAFLSRGLNILLFMPLLALAVASFANAAERRRRLLWLSFPLTFLLFVSTWNIASGHYVLVLIPFMALFGAAGLEFFTRPLMKTVATALLAALCLFPAFQSVAIDKMLTAEDTRRASQRWIRENIPADTSILRLPYTPEFLPSDNYRVFSDWEYQSMKMDAARIAGLFDVVIVSSFAPGNPSNWEVSLRQYYAPLREWPRRGEYNFHNPRITIYRKKQ